MAAGLCMLAFALNCWADPALPTLFSDHMVLQQGREIHIWGKADPGEKVTVNLAGRGRYACVDGQSVAGRPRTRWSWPVDNLGLRFAKRLSCCRFRKDD